MPANRIALREAASPSNMSAALSWRLILTKKLAFWHMNLKASFVVPGNHTSRVCCRSPERNVRSAPKIARSPVEPPAFLGPAVLNPSSFEYPPSSCARRAATPLQLCLLHNGTWAFPSFEAAEPIVLQCDVSGETNACCVPGMQPTAMTVQHRSDNVVVLDMIRIDFKVDFREPDVRDCSRSLHFFSLQLFQPHRKGEQRDLQATDTLEAGTHVWVQEGAGHRKRGFVFSCCR
mmetsp:Transcript_7224/g.17004  ORF Transcript_7224/g.17004 Transcript_7224/m.17004 type:complete len:233 (+) Transcript_7224:1187-1885(+)